MNRILLVLVSLSVFSLHLLSQNDTVFNQLDEKGLKQGFWQKPYPNGKLMYKGEFKDNKPVGIMKRYYENGTIQAIMQFDDTGEYTKAKLYYEDGELSAEGNFHQMQKDSVWRYYSYYSGALVSEETYTNGVKNGKQLNYFDDGQVSEEITWQNNSKEGPWIQYFPNGKEKMKANYSFNTLNGRYYFYYENGLIMILGNYDENKRQGPWVFYDEKGKEKYRIEYNFGVAQNADALLKDDEEYFKKIEENMGKYEDPSIEDFFPGGPGY